jgi:ribosomal protein S18 acetylase RimI-like enzyme
MKIMITRNRAIVCELGVAKLNIGAWNIVYIETDPKHRGKGLAAEALARLERLADRQDVCLLCVVDSDNTGLTYDQSVVWLKRHGFKHGWCEFHPNWRKRGPIREPRQDAP